jgi:iron complex outermembrane receptor protein
MYRSIVLKFEGMGLLSLALAYPVFPAELRGTVRLAGGEPAAAAEVRLSEWVLPCDDQGRFKAELPPGRATVEVSLAGWKVHRASIDLPPEGLELEITLEPVGRFVEEVVVGAIHSAPDSARSLSELPLEHLSRVNFGQEMPFVLTRTPSVAAYSETGLQLGGGYSYYTLRGMPQSRVNMTVDGVPLNDPEESAVYFANFGDFTSALSSIQIERGASSTAVGSAAYAGAIRFESLPPAERTSTFLDLTAGEYGTARSGLAFHSGRMANGLAFWVRGSYQTTDGYRERSGVRQRSLYLGGDWRGTHTYFKFFGFSGRERTELAFYAVEPWILEENPRFNPMQPEEKDAFGQDLLYFQLARDFGDRSDLAVQLYYSGAQGSLDLFDDPESRTGLTTYGIDGGSYGVLAVGRWRSPRFKVDLGLHALDFKRDHFAFSETGAELYRNQGLKDETALFVKTTTNLGERSQLFADLEVRAAEFRYRGEIGTLSTDWTFANPRVGLRYATESWGDWWVSLARTEREPVRNDLLEGEDHLPVPIDLGRVRPEQVTNLELGWSRSYERGRVLVGLYAMEFRDEIAATGEQSELGYAIRRNLPESYRRGVELEAHWQLQKQLELRLAGNWARNRVRLWRQLLDVYRDGEYVTSEFVTVRNRPTALSPDRTASVAVLWSPLPELSFELAGRHVGRTYLDNLGLSKLSAPSYSVFDLTMRANLGQRLRWGQPVLTLRALNLLDEQKAWAAGYSYPFLVRNQGGELTLDGIPYFYPHAPRHFLVGVELSWP